MQPSQRFAELMEQPAASVPLDEAAFLIAAHAHPGLDVGAQLARLDDLAARCPDASRDGVLAHLFGIEAFRGNDADYYDPDNSMLDRVLDRRRGIPITLSVVLIEVGRRLGVPFTGIGAPGHFIVCHEGSGVYIDPFNGGRALGAAERAQMYGATPLEPSDSIAIVSRMLANLKAIYAQRGDADALRWVIRLRVLLPDAPASERAELKRLLAHLN
jgi:regulator of sirC expression with transglutaminase-like and TPR domain